MIGKNSSYFYIMLSIVILTVEGSLEFASFLIEDAVKSAGKSTVEKPPYLQTYDFIIVGSGPAGCVLANRLSENKDWNILLIEAGTVETSYQKIPLNSPYHVGSRYNWGYKAEYQNSSCRGLRDGRCLYPRGKALGGSSVINGMIYTRGSKGDFDHWKELGIDGWDYYTEVLPAFKKTETANLKYFHKLDFHGYNGPLSVVSNPFSTPAAEIFLNGMKSLGYDEIDYNSDDSIGVGRLQASTKGGRRHSAFEAFIRPVLNKRNLDIMINTRVTKILINPNTKEVYGVKIHRNKRKMEVFARREVILSAGTFHSPQLLILSGIGSTEDLERLKIPQILNLPVGKIMYDHLAFIGAVIILDLTNDFKNPLRIDDFIPNTLDYLQGEGIFTIPNGAEALGFVKVGKSSTPNPSQPNVEILFVSLNPTSDGGYAAKVGEGISDELYENWFQHLGNFSSYVLSIGVTLLHPKSIGYMEVVSSNIYKSPKFYSNFLKDPEDVETILDGIRFLENLIQTPQFKQYNARLFDLPIPMCSSHAFNSDDYWRCAIRVMSISLHHQVGTCKMGSRSDKSAVVDSKLKVIGAKNLRVIDTSVIPSATSAHTNAVSFMIGERGADLIKMEHWV